MASFHEHFFLLPSFHCRGISRKIPCNFCERSNWILSFLSRQLCKLQFPCLVCSKVGTMLYCCHKACIPESPTLLPLQSRPICTERKTYMRWTERIDFFILFFFLLLAILIIKSHTWLSLNLHPSQNSHIAARNLFPEEKTCWVNHTVCSSCRLYDFQFSMSYTSIFLWMHFSCIAFRNYVTWHCVCSLCA